MNMLFGQFGRLRYFQLTTLDDWSFKSALMLLIHLWRNRQTLSARPNRIRCHINPARFMLNTAPCPTIK